MQRFVLCFYFMLSVIVPFAQKSIMRLQGAVKVLEVDSMLKHALIGLCVADSKTGSILYEKNAQAGLAPASCQKVITSVAALEQLGISYRYGTQLGYDGSIKDGTLHGNLHITGTGDPTLGSRRYPSTGENDMLAGWISTIQKAGILKIDGKIICDNSKWGSATVPDGWIWQDIGNYYGAGAAAINWRENQYDLVLKPGKLTGDTCAILSTNPELLGVSLVSEVTTGPMGSGDNAYIYLPPNATTGIVRGTIPSGTASFTISGSFPNSSAQLASALAQRLAGAGITMSMPSQVVDDAAPVTPLITHLSPTLDSINYWFLKRSINLYGEALIRTMAFKSRHYGSTELGVSVIKDFWAGLGIDKAAINITDGSGLSPQNRVTTDALVKVMQYARGRPWFASFFAALPQINGITMKSGSINGVRSFTGYITSAAGDTYTFAFIVNNYDGSPGEMIRKMYRVLDVLK